MLYKARVIEDCRGMSGEPMIDIPDISKMAHTSQCRSREASSG